MKTSSPVLLALKSAVGAAAFLAVTALLPAQTGTALVRHAPTLNGAVEGSLQVFLGENVTFNSNAAVTGDLLVPGTPAVQVHNNAHYGGTLDGAGSATPTGYTIALNSNATLGHVVRRTNPGALPVVNPPPLPAGTRTVVLTGSSQSAGDFATLRNLTLNSNAGSRAVPPGTYGDFTANSNSGFILGVAGSATPAVYDFQSLTLNSNTTLEVVGPVIVTLNGIALNANGTLGSADHPAWLRLRLAAGHLALASNATLYAVVEAPAGTITLNSNSRLIGGAASDRLVLNSNGLLRVQRAPAVALTAPADNAVFPAPATIALAASVTPGDAAVARVDFYSGATLLGSDAAAPYQFDWANVPAGSYTLTAVATDTAGASTTSAAAHVIVNAAPTVALTAPAAGAVFTAPAAEIVLATNAVDSDGTIARVDFYAGATLLGTATSAPFEFHWTDVAAGNYALTAIATDNRGAIATSAPIAIVVNAPPAVALVAPASGALFIAPASIAFAANASDADGTIARVDFYAGATLLGAATSAPYEFNLSGASSGTYTLTVVATDNLGAATTSTPVTVVVDAPPAVALTSPANGAVVTAPGAVTLAAAASDPDGTVARVEFFDGVTKVGESATSPFQLPLTGLAAGEHTFTARATDNLGVTTTSAAVAILVNAPPTVALTAPAGGSIFTAPAANISLSADAADSDGTIARVDFFQGTTLLGSATSAPYQFEWTDVTAGTYTVKAVAVDNHGASTASELVSIVVNAPPTVALTAPADGAVLVAPATLTLAATAADSDGSIARVDFYRNGSLVGTSVAGPHAVIVSGLAAGGHTFVAVATDNHGATTASAEVSITVNDPPTVALTAPAAGATFAAPASVTLRADAGDSDGFVASVDFYQGATLVGTATTAPYQFSVSGLAIGNYTFTAVATDDQGATTLSAPVSISVHANHAPAVALTTPANNAAFTAPASIALAATAADDDGTVSRVDFYQGATLLGTASAAPYQFNWTNVAAGNYSLTAVATDNLGATAVSAPVAITVSNPAPATITFDSVSSGTILTATTSLSWSHTLIAGPGNSRAVVVGVVSRGSSVANASASGATFNGVPMLSLATSIANAGSGTFNRSQLFYLLDASLPAAGTYTVQVTFATSQSTGNNPSGGAIALTNVSQVAPAGFNNSSGTSTANTITTVVPASTGSWVVDTLGVGSTTANILTNAAGMVLRFNVPQSGGSPNSGAAGSTSIAGASGSVTMSWKNATAREVHSLAVFTPALSVQTPPTITTQPVAQTVSVGTNVSLSVVATGTAPLSYQWFKNGAPVAGATASTLGLPNAQTGDSGSYTVLVSNAVGSVTSNPATLVVNVQPPAIVTQPASQSANLGDPVTLGVTATGTAPLGYQWFKNGAPIAGATTSSLTFASVQASDAAGYQVNVSNAAGTVSSDLAILSVNTGPVAPTIVTQPLNQNVGVGANVAFAVTAAGTGPLSYQWQKDAVDLPGATLATLNLSGVQFGDAGSYRVVVSNAVGSVTSNAAILTVNALTSPSAAYNLTGFATAGAGTTGGGLIAETDAAYKKVSTPLEFANAVNLANKTLGAVKVIEIMNDLSLGWNEIGAAVQSLPSNAFRAHNAPLLHPVLLVTGVSVIDFKPKNGLTIFSANGATIRHATLNIKGASNLIVRNLRFDEMWEWDEATKGDYDKNDWDFITLSNGSPATNIWIDHCTFTKGYDGIVDMKAGTQFVTLSWCRYVGDDGATNPNSFVRQQLNALEANRPAYPFYNFLRTNGFSLEDIVLIQQGHDKGHLMGSNSLDAANATLSATFHHQWFTNLWDRCVPRLRAGNVHNYNIYVDDTAVLAAKRLRDLRAAAMSTANRNTLNNTYSFNPPINGSISTEGGAILVEKSAYLDCLTPLRNNQTDVTNPQYTGKILALDTIYHMDNANGSTTDFRGNSTDAGSPLGPFQAPVIAFSWNLAGNVLPYSYTLDDPAALLPLLQAGAGAGTITWSKENWLKVSY